MWISLMSKSLSDICGLSWDHPWVHVGYFLSLWPSVHWIVPQLCEFQADGHSRYLTHISTLCWSSGFSLRSSETTDEVSGAQVLPRFMLLFLTLLVPTQSVLRTLYGWVLTWYPYVICYYYFAEVQNATVAPPCTFFTLSVWIVCRLIFIQIPLWLEKVKDRCAVS